MSTTKPEETTHTANSSLEDAQRRPPEGSLELKALGHELIRMLRHAGGGEFVPPWLKVVERPVRSEVKCPICGAKANAGVFLLAHAYRDEAIKLPYLAVHALAAHGDLTGLEHLEQASESVIPRLRSLLNRREQALAARLLLHLAMGGVEHGLVKGVVACVECGDPINMGQLTLLGSGLELPYIAVHALVEHRDARYAGGHLVGEIDLDRLEAALGAGPLTLLGKRLAAILPFFGGTESPPAGLQVVENPLRGQESCILCGAVLNMGSFTLLRRDLGMAMTLPFIAVHALIDHDSAHYQGTLHDGRIDVRALRRMMTPSSG